MNLLILEEKYGDFYLIYDTEKELHNHALDILQLRMTNGIYEKEYIDDVNNILSKKNGRLAWNFLLGRTDSEYENIHTEYVPARYTEYTNIINILKGR